MLGWLELATSPAVVKRALGYAVVVGAILITIDLGDAIADAARDRLPDDVARRVPVLRPRPEASGARGARGAWSDGTLTDKKFGNFWQHFAKFGKCG